MFGLKLPPEIMQLLANPAALGDQVKAFVLAANELVDAIDAQEAYLKLEGEFDEVLAESNDRAIYTARDKFKAEMGKLPKLTP